MVMFMMEIGLMIMHKEKENIIIHLVLFLMVNGNKIVKMVMVLKLGLMVSNMKVTTIKETSMAMVFFIGDQKMFIKEILLII